MNLTVSLCVFDLMIFFFRMHVVHSQGGAPAETTVQQVSTAMPAHRSPTPRLPMVTSAKTALFTLRRRTALLRVLQHHYHHHLRLQKLPLTPSPPPPPHHLSQVYTQETGVEGARQVRSC